MIVFSRLAFKEPITKPLGREKLGSQHASKDHDFRIVRSKAAEMSPSGVAFPINLISPQGMFVGPEMKERLRAANYHALDQA